MFNNYFYLSRAVFELNKLLCGSVITDIYTQEKHLLFFHISSEKFPDRHLIISTNPQRPYLLIREQHKKTKKNSISFFSEFLPAEILNFKIASNDRIISVELDKCEIFFSVKGKNTNIYLTDSSGSLHHFKKPEELFLSSIENLKFGTGNDFIIDHALISESDDIKEFRSKFPMISSEIKNEIIFRSSSDSAAEYLKAFSKIINEIFIDSIKVGLNNDLGKYIFVPSSFGSLSPDSDSRSFFTYNQALQYFLGSFHRQTRKKDISAELEKFFEKELSRLSQKLNKLKERIESGSKDKIYYNHANLLLLNKHLIKKGMEHIELTDPESNQIIKINLNPKLSPQENIDKYFEKAKDEKVNFSKSQELFKFSEEKFNELKSDHEKFQNAVHEKDIAEIHQKLIPRKERTIKMHDGLKFKYWHYILEDKYNVYIGRDSKSNDYLSVKFAKQNDYWFHARGMPGSHVVLRVENSKETVPKNIIKQAASLAAYYSKAKTAGTASVSYTFAKFVYKKKGLEPGKVFLTKEKTILVKPEIPLNSQLVNE